MGPQTTISLIEQRKLRPLIIDSRGSSTVEITGFSGSYDLVPVGSCHWCCVADDEVVVQFCCPVVNPARDGSLSIGIRPIGRLSK